MRERLARGPLRLLHDSKADRKGTFCIGRRETRNERLVKQKHQSSGSEPSCRTAIQSK